MSCDRITTWRQFSRKIRPRGCRLLKMLDQYPNSVLVAGCQRSGTTVLARVIRKSAGMVDYQFTEDDELDAALILSGVIDCTKTGRYCFQTTYLNECYEEYFSHKETSKIIWVIRNPMSVVYSLLHNWTLDPLNNLFIGCGSNLLTGFNSKLYEVFGVVAVSRLNKAALSYVGKAEQIFHIKESVDAENLMVIDYEDLVTKKERLLPFIYEFIGLPYEKSYEEMIHSKSLKKSDKLSVRERKVIEDICMPVYEKTKELAIDIE